MSLLLLAALSLTPRAAAMDILYYDGGAARDYAKSALDTLGLPYTSATSSNFDSYLVSGTYEVVVIDLASSAPSTSSWKTDLKAFIDGGGRVVMGYYNVSSDSTLYDAFDISSTRTLTSPPSSIYRWDTTHPIFTTPFSVANITSYSAYWSYTGNELSVSGSATALGGYSSTSSSTRGAIVESNDGRTIYNGFVYDHYTGDQDGDGTKDIVELVANEVTYVMGADCDQDGDGYDTETCDGPDCDDGNAAIHPGAAETCNSVDDDCDGSTDESAVDMDTWYRDVDVDGYGDSASTGTKSCTGPANYVANNEDCDDGDPDISPAATEYCDGIDNDCDSSIDESDAVDESTWYRDSDGDTYGDSTRTRDACDLPSGYTSNASDCDDGDAAINPAALEYCDSLDNNCNGSIDEAGAVDGATWYKDKDKDGYGDATSTTTACSTPSGYAANDDDCDDTTSSVSPASSERCNSRDDDCDGSIDEADAIDGADWYADLDGDTYGDATNTSAGCSAPAGYLGDSRDCDDLDATINPSADEHCDGVDEDCDGTTDDHAVDETNWYRDSDGDGYGAHAYTDLSCDAPDGYVDNDEDCNDSDASASPLGTETVYDGVDQDCDGADLIDADSDGYDASFKGGDDCDDDDASVHPGTAETADGADEDCDGVVDNGTSWGDDDGDGVSETGGDCDDTDDTSWPGGIELEDGADNDCDGVIDEGTAAYDDDGDGYTEDRGDCADGDASVNPGETEVPDNGVDEDCDGEVDDGGVDDDGDGYADEVDCDPASAVSNPGATEIDDGEDNDCDGTVDEGTTGGDDDYDGQSENDGDCNDSDETVFVGATEVANGRDDNCDGAVDEGTEVADDDGDGLTENAGDCDDTNASVAPGRPEVAANGLDDDCDGLIDEVEVDTDGDGVSVENGDCDDDNGWVRPGLPEMCDGFDNDCDGTADEELVDCELATDTADTGKGGPTDCGCQSTGATGSGLAALFAGVVLSRRRRSG